METRLTLIPGRPGTKKLVHEYGDRLICIRYRYDRERKRRYKTVELVVEEIEWEPSPRPPALVASKAATAPGGDTRGVAPTLQCAPGTVVGLMTSWNEGHIEKRIEIAGGIWNNGQYAWELRYDRAVKLGLESRIQYCVLRKDRGHSKYPTSPPPTPAIRESTANFLIH